MTIASPNKNRLAVDIGGTFTDCVLDARGQRYTTKVLTTPAAPERAVLEGAAFLLERAGVRLADLDLFVHGTTLATNALIERKGARTALIATDGFRDVLEIADESRFDQYDLYLEKPAPLVPRPLRFTVPERVDVAGRVLRSLDEDAVVGVIAECLALEVDSVAVAFLHGYANPAHEQRVAELLSRQAPGISISLASEVCPEAREYERTSTAVANAYVQPLMAGYLDRLARAVAAGGFRYDIHLMTSGGALTSLDTAARFPIRLVESGPAGGAILAARIAAERGLERIVSFDMGGTTAKICLIDRGQPLMARAFEVDRRSRFRKGSGFPVRIPVIEMVEIGAGGGSIARVDTMKRLTVGPDSAGAEPGPACYSRGGEKPCVTDADLVLGRIDPNAFAGGRVTLSLPAADTALQSTVGSALSLSVMEAARGVAEIVDENMANAARVHAVERGASLTERTLIAFGGAAPLHACRIAEKLGIARILVPPDAGVGSAIGFLAAPAAYELVRSHYMRLDAFDVAAANRLLVEMAGAARTHAASAAGGKPLMERRSLFMRYAGQGHEISVPLPDRALEAGDVTTLREAFEDAYRHLFSRIIPGAAIEIMSWVVAVGTELEPAAALAEVPFVVTATPSGKRIACDTASGVVEEIPVYERRALQPGHTLTGPALIGEAGTSTYVSARFDVAVDAGGALLLTAKAKGSSA